jgi:hypothetical protein
MEIIALRQVNLKRNDRELKCQVSHDSGVQCKKASISFQLYGIMLLKHLGKSRHFIYF